MQKEQLKEQLTQALAGIAPKDATPQRLPPRPSEFRKEMFFLLSVP